MHAPAPSSVTTARPVAAPPLALIDTRSASTPFERGRRYGAAARERIARSLDNYRRLFASRGIGWDEACRRAQAHEPAIGALDAALVEELRGIAAGSGQPGEAILALNCRSEILPPGFMADGAMLAECTAIAVSRAASLDGHARLAQNWDWLGCQREALVVLRGADARGTEFVTLTEAGMLAKIGLNEHGFGVGLNILRSVHDGDRPGVPVHALLRRLLSCASLAQARRLVESVADGPGFGAASNVPCADARGALACFELAPAGWDECLPEAGVVVHTNHFLSERLSEFAAPVSAAATTEERLACARAHAARIPLDHAAVVALLRDESGGLHQAVCRHPDPALPDDQRLESVAGVVMDLAARRLWVAPDVPSRTEFAEIDCGWHDAPAGQAVEP